jgi:hypothetical protein
LCGQLSQNLPGASPAWDAGLCPPGGGRPAGLTWAVTPARGREKSRGPSNRPLNWASYRGRHAKQIPNRAPTYITEFACGLPGPPAAPSRPGVGPLSPSVPPEGTSSSIGYPSSPASAGRQTVRGYPTHQRCVHFHCGILSLHNLLTTRFNRRCRVVPFASSLDFNSIVSRSPSVSIPFGIILTRYLQDSSASYFCIKLGLIKCTKDIAFLA